MTRVRFVAASALAASLALGGIAFAQGPGPGGPGGRGGRLGGGFGGVGLPVRELNLTDAQQDQIRDIVQRHRDEMRGAQEKLRQAGDAQRQAIEAVPVDEGAIRAVTQQLADAETDAAILRARVRGEIWSILTPDQQTQAKKIQDERASRLTQLQQRLQSRAGRGRDRQRQP